VNPPIASSPRTSSCQIRSRRPAYTTYPPRVEFHEGFTPERFSENCEQVAARPEEPLPWVYVHLPFCRSGAVFCGYVN